jgi:large subunit ribosomal protein L3
MMPVWDKWGATRACTVLEVQDCQVIMQKTEAEHGYTALQVGAGWPKAKNVSKAMTMHFRRQGVPLKRHVKEFRVTEEGLLEPGTYLTARHFVPGQHVDVAGTSIGKGTQGVMKRHNFAGQPASHGASLSHRSGGSIGQCQDPGKVFKGKKMAGRMGNERVTVQNLQVMQIDAARNLIYVAGHVPGSKGGLVEIRDAIKRQTADGKTLEMPWPTHAAHLEGEAFVDEAWEGMAGEHEVGPDGRRLALDEATGLIVPHIIKMGQEGETNPYRWAHASTEAGQF